jgi:hypothetical protein
VEITCLGDNISDSSNKIVIAKDIVKRSFSTMLTKGIKENPNLQFLHLHISTPKYSGVAYATSKKELRIQQ